VRQTLLGGATHAPGISRGCGRDRRAVRRHRLIARPEAIERAAEFELRLRRRPERHGRPPCDHGASLVGRAVGFGQRGPLRRRPEASPRFGEDRLAERTARAPSTRDL